MQDLSVILTKNSFAVKELFRRYNVMGNPSPATIQAAYNKHGDRFMMKLLSIITPNETSSYTDTLTPIKPLSGVIQSTIDTKTLAIPTGATTESKSSGWTFWEKLLTAVSDTGKTIGQFKTDAAGNQIPVEVGSTSNNNSKLLYIGAAAFALLIIMILIFRR